MSELERRISQQLLILNYQQVHYDSIHHPEKFWAKASELVDWEKPWTKVLDNNQEPFTKWFVEGEINACYNAVDRHVERGKGNKVALIHDNPLMGESRKVTYGELLEMVSKLAGALARYGVEKGDRVLIYMSNMPETVMAMLACARLGAVHSVVFGGFAAGELCSRIQHAEPKVIIAVSCGLEPNKVVSYKEILDEALGMSQFQPRKCIILQREEIETAFLENDRDVDWYEAIRSSRPHPCVPVDSNDPLYILYTSGTTGDPKGIERPIGGHLVALVWSMKTIYGINSNSVWWTTSDFGWVVGHSYMCYAPLLLGITSVIYEGKPTKTPNPGQYFRVINDYKVNALFTVPTVLRILKQEDPEGKYAEEYNLSSLSQLWVAGENCDANTKQWAEKIFGVPVINHWWQTETGSAITAICKGLSNSYEPSTLTVGLPAPGYNIEVLRKDGTRANPNEVGRITVKLPLPPGTFSTLYKSPQKFIHTYFSKFPGYYDTLDAGYLDEDGFVYVTARADDVINVAGHRLSTYSLESIVLSHPDVSDACVVSVPDSIKSEVPLCLYVPRKKGINEELVNKELVAMIRQFVGPIASFKLCAAVDALPVTRSGKICRKSLSDLARGKLTKIPVAVVDPLVYNQIREVLRKMGFNP